MAYERVMEARHLSCQHAVQTRASEGIVKYLQVMVFLTKCAAKKIGAPYIWLLFFFQFFPIVSFSQEVNIRQLDSLFFGELNRASLIGVGEATHGSGEFYKVRTEIVNHLSASTDSILIFIEDGICATESLNEAVQQGMGIKEALNNLHYWIWKNEEALDLFEHLNHLIKSGKKIVIKGADFDAHCMVTKLNEQITLLSDSDSLHKMGFLQIENAGLEYRLSSGEDFFYHYKRLLQKDDKFSSSNALYLTLLDTLIVSKQIKNSFNPGIFPGRDEFMAKFILSEREDFPKVLIFAHNGHISYKDRQMGAYLKEVLQENYFSLGQGMLEGSFIAFNLANSLIDSFYVKGLGKDKVENSVVYMNPGKNRFLSEWIIGTTFNKRYRKTYKHRSMFNQYDGYLMLKQVSPARYFVGPGIGYMFFQFQLPSKSTNVEYIINCKEGQNPHMRTVVFALDKVGAVSFQQADSLYCLKQNITYSKAEDHFKQQIVKVLLTGQGDFSGEVRLDRKIKRLWVLRSEVENNSSFNFENKYYKGTIDFIGKRKIIYSFHSKPQ